MGEAAHVVGEPRTDAPDRAVARLGRRALALLALTVTGCGNSPGAPSPTPAPGTANTGVMIPNEGWTHVPEGSTISYRNNPPASGPHYTVWLRYEEYTSPMARGYYVHNLEHGAIVMLYRPDTPAPVVAALRDAFHSLPSDPECGHPRALLTPDPLLPQAAIFIVAADWVLSADTVDTTVVRNFVLTHRNHAPEDVCQGGTRP